MNFQYLDVRVTMVRCSRLERSRHGKLFYCKIPADRIATPKVLASNFGYSDLVDRGLCFLQL